jgi:hypothetical protein
LKDDLEGEGNHDEQTNTNGAYMRTRNEIDEVDFLFPDFEQVGTDETLEHVGEVLSVIGNTVVVRGNASEVAGRASEIALDSETLLVFEDRKVLGYVSIQKLLSSNIPKTLSRFMRRLARLISLYIKSNLVKIIPWILTKSALRVESSMYPSAADLFFSIKSIGPKAAMPVTLTTKNRGRTSWISLMMNKKPLPKGTKNASKLLDSRLDSNFFLIFF